MSIEGKTIAEELYKEMKRNLESLTISANRLQEICDALIPNSDFNALASEGEKQYVTKIKFAVDAFYKAMSGE